MLEIAVAGFTELLEKDFSIPVIGKDIQENFPRPAFVLQTENIEKDKIGLLDHVNFDLEIYYYGKSRNSGYAELYTIMQKMKNLLSHDRVTFSNGYIMPIEEIEFLLNRKDMVLLTTLNLDMVDEYTEPEYGNTAMMEELHTRLKGV